jgi:hypothetical protein
MERGDLSHPEFLDLCAGDLGCDGVVLDVHDFPRNDVDYLAHVKKTCADRGLTVAALSASEFLTCADAAMQATLQQAADLGAPLLAAPLSLQTDRPWSDQLERLNAATSLAKRFNVTLALRNAPATFAETTYDCKRVAKEADSAWLRFGPEPDALPAVDDARDLSANSVLVWCDAVAGEPQRLQERFPGFRAYLALDRSSGDASVETMRDAIVRWRQAICRALERLNRT